MSVRFSVEIQGKAEFDRAFNRVSAGIEDFSTIWEAVRGWLKRRLKRQFDSEGANNKWRALSPGYKAWKQIHFPGTKILYRTGKLKESLVSGNSDTVDRVTKTSLDYGTKTPYAKRHQDGAGNLPQRKIFDFNERDRREITQEIQRPLIRLVRQQGFEVFEF